MFWHRCERNENEVEIQEEQNVHEASLFSGNFLKRCYIPTFQGFEERQRTDTAVFSILHVSGKVNRLYISFYFHFNINLHVPLC